MVGIDTELKQKQLFNRYIKYILAINEANNRDEPMNSTLLDDAIGIPKQQNSPVLVKLELNGLITRDSVKKWQEKGGKSKYCFLTPLSIKLLIKYQDEFDDKSIEEINLPELKKNIDRYNKSNSTALKDRAMYDIYLTVDKYYRNEKKYVNWNKIEFAKVFIDTQILKIMSENVNVHSRFFSILEMFYEQGYYDENNFIALKGIIDNVSDISGEIGNVEHVLRIAVIGLSNHPEKESEPYNLLVRVFKKYRTFNNHNREHCILNPLGRPEVKHLQEEIKKGLIEEIYEILDSIEDEVHPSLLNNIIDKIRDRW